MALADITLNDSQATPVSHVFSYVGTENGQIIRKNLAKSPETPETLILGHKKVKVNGVEVDSHLWRLNQTKLDADGVTVRRRSIRVIIEEDPMIYSDADAEDLATMLVNGMSETFVKSFMKGSVG